jgi:hypothetical protein
MFDDRKRLQEDEDYIHNPKLKNSIEEVQKKYPDGVSDKDIAKMLSIPIKHVRFLYASAIKKIRKKIKGA